MHKPKSGGRGSGKLPNTIWFLGTRGDSVPHPICTEQNRTYRLEKWADGKSNTRETLSYKEKQWATCELTSSKLNPRGYSFFGSLRSRHRWRFTYFYYRLRNKTKAESNKKQTWGEVDTIKQSSSVENKWMNMKGLRSTTLYLNNERILVLWVTGRQCRHQR
jgi:hypothetical protein